MMLRFEALECKLGTDIKRTMERIGIIVEFRIPQFERPPAGDIVATEIHTDERERVAYFQRLETDERTVTHPECTWHHIVLYLRWRDTQAGIGSIEIVLIHMIVILGYE